MNNPLLLGLAVLAGLALGAFFFGGLWWTIRRGAASPRPALWFLGSALLRMGMALAGFYFVGGGVWQRLLACLVGFLIARLLVTRWVPSSTKADASATSTPQASPPFSSIR